MILLSVSLPGRFGDWCNAVLAQLAGHSGDDVGVFSFPSLHEVLGYDAQQPLLAEIGRSLIGSQTRHYAIAIRQADKKLRTGLTQAGPRLVLALDDPCNTLSEVLADSAVPVHVAVRAVANCCVLAMPFATLPRTLTIRAEDARGDPVAVIAAMAAHFGIAVAAETAAAIAAKLPPPDGYAPLSGAVGRIADGALGAYQRSFASGSLDRIVWTRELFILFGDSGAGTTAPIELGNGVKALFYGPYIYLPAGSWLVRVVLGFSPEAADASFLVDVYAEGAQLAATTFQPGRGGVYTAELIFSIGEPSGQGVEVRAWVTSEHAAGRLALGHVVLQPLGMHDAGEADPSADFERVLDL